MSAYPGSASLILLAQLSSLAVELVPRWCLVRSFPVKQSFPPEQSFHPGGSVPFLTEYLGTHPILQN